MSSGTLLLRLTTEPTPRLLHCGTSMWIGDAAPHAAPRRAAFRRSRSTAPPTRNKAPLERSRPAWPHPRALSSTAWTRPTPGLGAQPVRRRPTSGASNTTSFLSLCAHCHTLHTLPSSPLLSVRGRVARPAVLRLPAAPPRIGQPDQHRRSAVVDLAVDPPPPLCLSRISISVGHRMSCGQLISPPG